MNRRSLLKALTIQAITVPRAGYPRAEVEAKLLAALKQDIEDAHSGILNWALRNEINNLIGQLSRGN